MRLHDVLSSHSGRAGTKWTYYPDYYERHLAEFVGKPLTLFEIGVEHGGSLQVWRDYFGPDAQIVGLDIEPSTMYSEPQITTLCGNQSDPAFLQSVVEQFGPPDIVIDDGSHRMYDILTSFDILYPHLRPDGYYIVEDLHTAYWAEFGGGLKSPLNFVDIAGRFVHEVNRQFIREADTPSIPPTSEIAFYNSMIFFRKGPQAPAAQTFYGDWSRINAGPGSPL